MLFMLLLKLQLVFSAPRPTRPPPDTSGPSSDHFRLCFSNAPPLPSFATAGGGGGFGADADTATSGPAALRQPPSGHLQPDGSDAAAVQLDVAAEVLYGIVRHCRRLPPELCALAADLMDGMLMLQRGMQQGQQRQRGGVKRGVTVGGILGAGGGAVCWPGAGLLLVEVQGALAAAAEEREEEGGKNGGQGYAGGEHEGSVCVRGMWVSSLAAALRDCVGNGGRDAGGDGEGVLSLDTCVRLEPAPARSHERRGSIRQQPQWGHTRGQGGGQGGVVLCVEPVAVLTAAVLQVGVQAGGQLWEGVEGVMPLCRTGVHWLGRPSSGATGLRDCVSPVRCFNALLDGILATLQHDDCLAVVAMAYFHLP